MKKVTINTDEVSTPGPMNKKPYGNSDPVRAFEPHMDASMGMGGPHPMAANHIAASRVGGAGINFGRVGNKPDHSNAVPRDNTTSRNAMNPRI